MKRSFFASMAACAAMLLGLSVQAAPTLTLSSSANLNTLTVGQSTTITVALSGLTAGQQLQELLGSIAFSPTLFAQPTSVIPGPILSTTSPMAFQTSTTTPGFLDGLFDTGGFLGASITSNGVFFSFTLKALAKGAGSVSFDTVDGLFVNGANPLPANVIAGASLPVVISAAGGGGGGGGGGAVPLPAGLPMGLATLGAIALSQAVRVNGQRRNRAA